MTDLSLARAIPEAALLSSLGERFTVALDRGFVVHVNQKKATVETSLPRLEFRVPPVGVEAVHVGGREVRAWAGFAGKASWPQDAAGVGVYAHGKIAQDRPFFFGVKGKEIWTRYMYAVVEADWLDELPEDLISTDRTSVNWDSAEVQDLFIWGQEAVRRWIADFAEWREKEEKGRNRELVKAAVESGGAAKVTDAEQEQIVELVSRITPSFGADEEGKEQLVATISDAWVQKPMRRLVKDLWSSLGASGKMPPQGFTDLISRLSTAAVPESLNLAVVFAQRAFALSRLHDFVHHGVETDLQKLITRFPWIVEPDLAVLTANESLRTALTRAEASGQVPTGRRSLATVPDQNRPDFVFMSSPEERQIVIVELKNPQEELTIANRQQLSDYMAWFEQHYSSASLKGFLIGSRPQGFQTHDARMVAVEWTEVLRVSRTRNLELLAAMILATGGSGATDSRLADAIELGGKEAQEMLARLSAEHDELRELMEEFGPAGSPAPTRRARRSATKPEG